MITADEIIRRLRGKYRDVLRAWLAGEDFSPIEFPVGVLSKNLLERRQQIEGLRAQSKEICGIGYELTWDTVNMQALGRQTIPRRAVITNLHDYLALIRKRKEFDGFTADVEKIRQRFPVLESWMHACPQDVVKHHGQWDDLLTVCAYFVENPRPNVYIRELPIPVHTKFIESHGRILRDLLDVLLPAESINEDTQDFIGRFGLRGKPAPVRLRLLEEQLGQRYGIWIDDLSLPVNQLEHLLAEHIRPKRVIIVENLVNFLTLPKMVACVGLLGSGFAVHLLRDVHWLLRCDVVYWGDIDAHGFEMLSDLRGLFPHTRSVMMDRATFDAHAAYVADGSPSRSQRYEHLTGEERQLSQYIAEHSLRLEQEHIPHAYAARCLEQFLRHEG